MRPLTRWISALGAVALVSVMFIPWPMTENLQSQLIEHPLARLTGLKTVVKGPVTISFLPSPELHFSDVSITGAGGIEISAARISSKLRLLPLLGGRFETYTISMIDPEISLYPDKARTIEQSPPSAEAKVLAAISPFGTISIRNGKASLRGPSFPGGIVEITGIDAVLDWQDSASPAAMSGQGHWGGEKIDLSLLLAKPGELASAKASPFTLNLRSPLANINLDADIAASPRWQIAGRLKASTENLDGLHKAISHDDTSFLPVQAVHITAQTRIQASSVWLSELQLNLDQNDFNGTITIQDENGKANVTGTLAAAKLNLDAFSRTIPDPLVETGWSYEALQISNLSRINMDIRLSTGDLRVQHVSLADVAMSSLVKDGRLELSLSSGKSYGGVVKARMSLNTATPLAQLRVLLQFDGVDTAAFLRDATGSQRLSGTANGEVEIRTQGRSILDFFQNSQGTARAAIGAGIINGLDLDRAARQAQVQPLSVSAGLRNGRTAFNRSDFSASIEGGVVRLTKAGTEANELSVEYSGTISLIARTLDIAISAKRNPSPAIPAMPEAEETPQAAQTPANLRLELAGPWSQPILQPDADGLINHSQAAAPLQRNIRPPGGNEPNITPRD